MVFVLSEQSSIDDILDEFEARFRTEEFPKISEEKRELYEQFAEEFKGYEFINKSEALDTLLLFSYLVGDRSVYDHKDCTLKRIKGKKDLQVLSRKNIKHKNEVERFNEDLLRAYNRFNNRYDQRNGLDWGAVLDKIFLSRTFIEHFREKLSYDECVLGSIQHTEDEDRQKLKEYILGKHEIVDATTLEAKIILSVEDLYLFSNSNVTAKRNEEFVNLELRSIYGRVTGRKQRRNTLNWGETLDLIFQEIEVTSYLGVKAVYGEHVNIRVISNNRDTRIIRDYLLGKNLIIDRTNTISRKIESYDDISELLSIANIRGKSEETYNNPELYRCFKRIQNRHPEESSVLWIQTIYRIALTDKEVMEYLKGPTLRAIGLDMLQRAVTGKYEIWDPEGNRRRIKRARDLELLKPEVFEVKNERGQYLNPEFRNFYRMVVYWRVKFDKPSWSKTIDEILSGEKARKKFGRTLKYHEINEKVLRSVELPSFADYDGILSSYEVISRD